MPSDDRDSQFERALAHHLHGGPASAGCPDAEILASYHERSLSLDEMAEWKKHIAGCAACQEALALVEATEKQLAEDWEGQKIPVLEAAAIHKTHPANVAMPAAAATAQATPPADERPVVTKSRRRPVLMRWAIPLGTVAAGVLIWIGIHEQGALQSSHSKSVEVAQNRAAAAPQDQEPGAPEPKARPPMERDSRRTEANAETGRQDAATSDHELRQLRPAAPTPRAGNLAKDAGTAKKESAGKFAYSAPAAAPEIPQAKTSSEASADKLTAENRPAAIPPPSPASVSPGASAGGVVDSRGVDNTAGAGVVPSAKERAKAAQRPAANLDTNAMMMKQGASSETVQVIAPDAGLILTPDKNVFWRLQPAGTVELTTNGGKKWKSLHTGAGGDLTAGFAPSDRVCWIAGKAGTLVLTTDRGGHWTTIPTPIPGDLGGVHAADAKHASIWDAVNNKSYETSDGGATWKQTASE